MSSKSGPPVRIFISYAHEDEKYKDELEKRLKGIKRQFNIDYWSDRQLFAGERFEQKIFDELKQADIVCLLISPDFIASDYCFNKEMEQALQKYEHNDGIPIPIIIRRTNEWHAHRIGQHTALPTDGKPLSQWNDSDDFWADVQEGVRRQIERIQGGLTPGQSPNRYNFHDFTLKLTKDNDVYLIEAESPRVGKARVTIRDKDIDDLVPRAPDYFISIDQAEKSGYDLYQLVFQNSIHKLFADALHHAQAQAACLRICISSKSPELHWIPWELLHNGCIFLAVSPEILLYHSLERPGSVPALQVERPLRALITTAIAQGDRLTLETEAKSLRQIIDRLGRGTASATMVDLPSSRRLRLLLRGGQNNLGPFHIWHHYGYGDMVNQAGKRVFMLKLEEDTVEGEEIVKLVQNDCASLRLVVFNVCGSGALEGLVPALAAQNVPGVIGFRGKVTDQAASLFASTFYNALLDGSVAWAFKQGVQALYNTVSPADGLSPVLFLRANDLTLL